MQKRLWVVGSILLAGTPLGLLSCGQDNPVPPGDTTRPAAVTTLSVESVTTSGALLTWIATGDDSLTGTASDYDIRYSLEPRSSATWWDSLTTTVPDTLTPKAPGEAESLLVTGLLPDTLYSFALVVLDEEGNSSALSNVDTARTLGGGTPILAIDPDTLAFGAALTDSSFTITNGGDGTLTWTITDDQSWISVDPTSDSTTTEEDTITVTVSRTGLSTGSHSGTVTVTSNAGDPQEVDVSMTVAGEPEPGSMVLVPAGSFQMGGDSSAFCGSSAPQVTLTHDFYVGKYEVTNGEYAAALQWAYDQGYVTATSSTVQDSLDGSSVELVDLASSSCQVSFSGGTFTVDSGKEDHPMVEVSWYGAAAYCDWLSAYAGLARAYDHSTWECNGGAPYAAGGYRLPTDAEWESVTQVNGERVYPWGDESPDCNRANYAYCVAGTAPVGSYPSGAVSVEGQSVYDMGGNVWEWCGDAWTCDLGGQPLVDPYRGGSSSDVRVLRGGSLSSGDSGLRAAFRYFDSPSSASDEYGFRCARSH